MRNLKSLGFALLLGALAAGCGSSGGNDNDAIKNAIKNGMRTDGKTLFAADSGAVFAVRLADKKRHELGGMRLVKSSGAVEDGRARRSALSIPAMAGGGS